MGITKLLVVIRQIHIEDVTIFDTEGSANCR